MRVPAIVALDFECLHSCSVCIAVTGRSVGQQESTDFKHLGYVLLTKDMGPQTRSPKKSLTNLVDFWQGLENN